MYSSILNIVKKKRGRGGEGVTMMAPNNMPSNSSDLCFQEAQCQLTTMKTNMDTMKANAEALEHKFRSIQLSHENEKKSIIQHIQSLESKLNSILSTIATLEQSMKKWTTIDT